VLISLAVVGVIILLMKVTEWVQRRKTTHHTIFIESITHEDTIPIEGFKVLTPLSETRDKFALGRSREEEGTELIGFNEKFEDGSLCLDAYSASKITVSPTLKEGEQAYAVIVEDGWGISISIELFVPENTVYVDAIFR